MQSSIASLQFNILKERLYKSTNLIHVSIPNKRKTVMDAPSKIIGIYQRFLCVESKVNTYVKKFTIQEL